MKKTVAPTKKEVKVTPELTPESPEAAKEQAKTVRVIMNMAMLLVVLSIAYSTYRIMMGTSEITSWIWLIPQVIFAAGVLIKQFTK